jgi:Fur family peroxide stress response transcriptional regulator
MGVTDMMETGLIPTHTSSVSSVKIVDPDLDSLDDMKKEVALETNFKILNHRLDFFGICSNCISEKI